MTTVIGRLDEFQMGKDDFDCYIERMEQYFVANAVPEDKQVAAFLTVIGVPAYELLRNLILPETPKDKTLAELKTVLRSHLKPKPLTIAERFKFHKRSQREMETVAEYVVALKELSTHCEFGNFLNDALRDRLVCGLYKESIQKRLLSESELTFAKACEIAQAMELADKNASELHSESTRSVNAIQNPTVREKANTPETQTPETKKRSGQNCYRCGGTHSPATCRFKSEKCRKCGKFGHIAKKCHTKQHSFQGEVEEQTYGLFGIQTCAVSKSVSGAYMVTVEMEGHKVDMLIDTGAVVSIVPEHIYKMHLSQLPLRKARDLRSYSGDKLNLLGEVTVTVMYNNQKSTLPLVIVKGEKPALFGRNWLEKIKLNWGEIFAVEKPNPVDRLIKKYAKLFEGGHGKINNFKATVALQPDTKPIYRKARPVPYALKQQVEAELDRLEQQGIIKKVERSNWAAPIVIVPKTDKSLRICGDYKVTINPWVRTEGYPLPTIQDLFSSLSNGKYFTKLDLQHAYQQLEVEESSQELLTINTHKGLYQYVRLPFGISSAPSIFQAVMDQILKGQKNTVCYLDDILIMGQTKEEHDEVLEQVLQRLQDHGIRLTQSKCKFAQDSVEYLGHRIDAAGLHPTKEKIQAVVNAPEPRNVAELKAYLGLLNYYGRFLPNLSTTLQPLNELLCKTKKWKWSSACQKAFCLSKEALVDSQALAHYDPTKPIRLACDASPYGVGAVISQLEETGQERPVAFASRSLNKAERNYAQIE